MTSKARYTGLELAALLVREGSYVQLHSRCWATADYVQTCCSMHGLIQPASDVLILVKSPCRRFI